MELGPALEGDEEQEQQEPEGEGSTVVDQGGGESAE
jgi:hypothetical protein